MTEVSVAQPPVEDDEAKLADVLDRLQPYNQPVGADVSASQRADNETPAGEVKPPIEQTSPLHEQTEITQDKIHRIQQNETRNVSLRILDHNSNQPEDFKPETQSQLIKYNNILDLFADDYKDGPTPYKHKNSDGTETKYDYIPLNWNSNGPYVIEKNGVFMPSDFKIDGSVQVIKVKEKHGTMLTCEDANGNDIKIELDLLADAQAHAILRSNQTEDTLPLREVAVLEAYDELAQTGNGEKITALHQDMSQLIESARHHGMLTADAIDAYLASVYPEIQKDENSLTAEEIAHNKTMQQRKQEIRKNLALDHRAVADGEVLAGIATQTSADALHNLTEEMVRESDPVKQQQLQAAIKLINDNQDKLPQMIETVMSKALPPTLVEGLNADLRNGDLAGVYDKLLKQFPNNEEKIKEYQSKLGENALKIGGFGLIAILAALAFGVTSQGLRQ